MERKMTYEETLEYIHGVNWCFCKPGLERIGELCTGIGDPQDKLRFVHVAGTNGKGSFCAMTASILREAGLCVGLYTSPYIKRFNERICVNGTPISDEELAEVTSYVRPTADAMKDRPTEFELITAVAFEYFRRRGCDIVVLEAGMGGRLDSTNIIKTPVLSVITGVALDHVAYLGDTVEKIAGEKAGIIKKGVPVLWGGNDERARRVIEARAAEVGAQTFCVDRSKLAVRSATLDGTEFDFGDRKGERIRLLGLYQPLNAANAISAAEILRTRGFDISDGDISRGLERTRWHARFEMVSRDPTTIFDGAHNAEGISAAIEGVKHYFGNDVYVFTGVLADKDYVAIAADIAKVASRAFVITPSSPRALPAGEYAAVLSSAGVAAEPFDDIKKAFTAARTAAKADGKALICLGSLYTYADIADLV